MQPWIHLDKTNIPGGGELKLAGDITSYCCSYFYYEYCDYY